MRSIAEVLSSPLRRVRVVSTLFSVVAAGSCATLMNSQLSVLRVMPAYLAVMAIIVNAVVVFVRERVGWVSVLVAAPLIYLAFLGMREKPASVALALSIIAGQALYGATRLTVVRTGVIATAAFIMAATTPPVGQKHGAVSTGIVPALVIVLFSVILRLLYTALHVHQAAAKREALMAATSRALLESVDLGHAEGIVRAALLQLAQDLDGLDMVLTSVAPPPSDGPVLALPSIGEYLVARGPAAANEETRSFMESLGAQLGLVRDNHAAHRELYTMAHHDLLTSLSNRRAFFAALTTAVDADLAPESLGVMLIDLDDFKAVNDTHGHAAGDAVLVEVARRMLEAAKPGATVARFGGDEFAILSPDTGAEELDELADRLVGSIRRPISWGPIPLGVGASVGIANAVAGLCSPGDLMRAADLAMYEAKSLGKNQVARHRPLPADHAALLDGRAQ